MNNDIRLLLDISETLNSQTVSLTRCIILTLLAYFVDGIQYRELKAALNISDGKLISNLNYLRLMQYIEKTEIEFDRKKMDIYTLSEKEQADILRAQKEDEQYQSQF